MADTEYDVVVVGSGVAGLTAGIFTARADLDTLVVNDGESILNRNGHLENVPGFPAGVNSRLFLDMTREQASRAGCGFREGRVVDVEKDDAFTVRVEDASDVTATYVVAASWSDSSYLEGLDVDFNDRGSKTYVEVDRHGRTDVENLYVAGRLAEQYHQTVVAAGDGATAALTLLEDSEVPFYPAWVAPVGFSPARGREVPPGCEEISEDERRRRERESMAVMQEYFAEPHQEKPTMHPSVVEKRQQEH